MAACALLLRDRHLFSSLVAAGSSGVTFTFFPLLSRLSGKKVFGTTRASLEHCIGKTEDLLVSFKAFLLIGRKTLVP
jgi:hypothetical protein